VSATEIRLISAVRAVEMRLVGAAEISLFRKENENNPNTQQPEVAL
jgi:hypothetical protein